jgi:hypothetical protein
MTQTNGSRQFAGVIVATLIGATFFFIIIGVFGLRFAIVGLLIFALGTIVLCRKFPVDGADL